MGNRPWMPLYVDDYLADTKQLTTLQHGAYLLLIMHYWVRGSLPDDDKQLARIVGLPGQHWAKYAKPVLAPMFQPGWRHKRIDKELARREELSTRRAVFGSRGSQMRMPFSSRWQKEGNGVNALKSNGVDPAYALSQSSISTHNHKERKKEAPEEERPGHELEPSSELQAIVQRKWK